MVQERNNFGTCKSMIFFFYLTYFCCFILAVLVNIIMLQDTFFILYLFEDLFISFCFPGFINSYITSLFETLSASCLIVQMLPLLISVSTYKCLSRKPS